MYDLSQKEQVKYLLLRTMWFWEFDFSEKKFFFFARSSSIEIEYSKFILKVLTIIYPEIFVRIRVKIILRLSQSTK